jgi:hypothetical protein
MTTEKVTWNKDRKAWLGSNGEYIVKYNWGGSLGYGYLRYQSKAEYQKGYTDFRSFDLIKDAKKAEILWESRPFPSRAGRLLDRLLG